MVERRKNFTLARAFLRQNQLVFLDESGAKTNMTRLYGRSLRGRRCPDHTPHGHWKTMTMLSAIRHDGVMRDATVVMNGPMDGPTFLDYVEQCLAPSLRPGDPRKVWW